MEAGITTYYTYQFIQLYYGTLYSRIKCSYHAQILISDQTQAASGVGCLLAVPSRFAAVQVYPHDIHRVRMKFVAHAQHHCRVHQCRWHQSQATDTRK